MGMLINPKSQFFLFQEKIILISFFYRSIPFIVYRLSVLADMGKFISVLADKKIGFIGSYQYWPIWKKAYRSYTARA